MTADPAIRRQPAASGPPPARRVLVAGGATRPADLAALAEELGWELGADRPRGHWVEREVHWLTGVGRGVVWREDHVLGVCLALVVEDDPDAAERVVALLRERLDWVDGESALDDAELTDDPHVLVRRLPQLAVLELPADEARCRRAFQRALTHPLPAVRRAAALPLVARLNGDEPWPGLRSFARAHIEEGEAGERLRSLLDRIEATP